MHDYAIVIGRFQPLHNGHVTVIKKALEVAHNVLVFIGSARQARNIRNPFTAQERADLILKVFAEYSPRITCIAVEDRPYNDEEWLEKLMGEITFHTKPGASIALVGHNKDASSFYLNMFPDSFKFVNVGLHDQIDATNIRQWFFTTPLSDLKAALERKIRLVFPVETQEFLREFMKSHDYMPLAITYRGVMMERKAWDSDASRKYGGPFLVTVDAVVRHYDRILIITRGVNPGAGLLALPGGFVNPDERIHNAVIRELEEETGLTGVRPLAWEVFDHPNRSSRGRVVTHAFLFDITRRDMSSFAPIEARDDAAEVQWMGLQEIYQRRDEFHDDHFHIIHNLIGEAYGYRF